MSAVRGLLFDVDGVIADTEAVNASASIRMLKDLFGLEGVVRADFEAGLGRGASAYVRAAAGVHGLELSDSQVEDATRVRQEYFLEELAANPLPAFPGVLPLMQSALDNPDWSVAIATSSTREKSEAVLKSARIPYDRMVYVTGSDVTHKKPDPELFVTACSRLGLPGDCCVVIEDAPNGVQAARGAGCRTVAVTNSTTAEKLSEADRVVTSLEEVRLGALEALLG